MANSSNRSMTALWNYGMPFLTFFLFYWLIMPLRGDYLAFWKINGMCECEIIATTLFFYTSYLFTKTSAAKAVAPNKWMLLVSMILGCIIVELLFLAFVGTKPTLTPFWVAENIAWALCIAAGFAYYFTAKPYRKLFLATYVLYALWVIYLFGFSNWKWQLMEIANYR